MLKWIEVVGTDLCAFAFRLIELPQMLRKRLAPRAGGTLANEHRLQDVAGLPQSVFPPGGDALRRHASATWLLLQ